MKNALKLLLVSLTGMMALLACDKSSTIKSDGLIAFWAKGNSFYSQQKWDSAASNYYKALRSGDGDASVYYNLGNAEYRRGHTGVAVLNYRRALLYKPDYQMAAENLELAESRIPGRLQPPEPVFFVRWWASLTEARYAGTWAVAALAFFVLAIIFLWRRMVGSNRIAPQLIVTLFIFWGISLAVAIAAGQGVRSHSEAVVIHPKVTLKSEDGKSIISVPEGTLVDRQTVADGRARVALPDGRSGWLPIQDIEAVD